MAYYYSDPEREPRECPACRGDGVGARINAEAPAGRADGPRLVELIPDGCRVCDGTGKLGDPRAMPDLDVFDRRNREGVGPSRGFWISRFRDANDRVCVGGPFDTEAEALADARSNLND